MTKERNIKQKIPSVYYRRRIQNHCGKKKNHPKFLKKSVKEKEEGK